MPAAVEKVLAEVREISGRVDVLLHAAGRGDQPRPAGQGAARVRPRAGGEGRRLFNVLHAARDLPLGDGDRLQLGGGPVRQRRADRLQRRQRPAVQGAQQPAAHPAGVRALAIDWTAWGGIGMATRGSIPKIMEMAGVEMLPPEAGVAWIRRELTGTRRRGEVVVAGALGALAAEIPRRPAGWTRRR